MGVALSGSEGSKSADRFVFSGTDPGLGGQLGGRLERGHLGPGFVEDVIRIGRSPTCSRQPSSPRYGSVALIVTR